MNGFIFGGGLCDQTIVMSSLQDEPGKIPVAEFIRILPIQGWVAMVAGLLSFLLRTDKGGRPETFIQKSQIKAVFFYELKIIYIGTDHPEKIITRGFSGIKYPGTIIANIGLVRHKYSEPTKGRSKFFPVASIRSVFFQADTAEKSFCLISQPDIISGATHFEHDDFKRSDKNIVALKVASSCAVHNIKTTISISPNSGSANDLSRYVFI